MWLASAKEMRDLDEKAVSQGIPALVLMENAGLALAREIQKVAGGKKKVAILAGPGQNGGDGLCAARHLASRGYLVTVALFADPGKLPPEARANYDMLKVFPVHVLLVDSEGQNLPLVLGRMEGACVIVDALLGTGQKGDPRPPLDRAIMWANASGPPIVSCDIPTGLCADTGYPYEPVVRASVTVTLGVAKIGLFSYPGPIYAGRVVVDSLGLPPSFLADSFHVRTFGMEEAKASMPHRAADHHKGLSGHVLVLGGSVGMAGAPVLSALAALRAGAGTVTLMCPKGAYLPVASMAPEIMVLPWGEGDVFAPHRASRFRVAQFLERSGSVVIGPGMGQGEEQSAFLGEILGMVRDADVPCALDADGLNGLLPLGTLSYLAGLGGKFILTPHPGELARLLGSDAATIGRDRVGYARKASGIAKSVVCLKGAGTCVANNGEVVTINTSGGPSLATAGTGDVLAGVVGALLAGGVPIHEAASTGVFWHGLAGDMASGSGGHPGALSSDVSRMLSAARTVIMGGGDPL